MLRRFARKFLTPYCWGMTSAEMGMRTESWSQFGEDRLLAGLLGDQATGTYVDVGAYDALYLSNTYLFYRAGWSGLAIDANPDVGASFAKFRPRDRFVNRAVGPKPGSVKLKRFECGAFNCLESGVEQVPEEFRKEIDTIEVPCESLAIILERNRIESIEVLSVDCEGFDLEVLQSNDWHRWRPKVVCVEDHSSEWTISATTQFMKTSDYQAIYRVGPSTIFKRN